MPNCCSNSSTNQACPQCGATCKSVEMRTLYHQVRFPENQGIILGRYYFCSSKDCSIGYFSIAGARIPKQHLRTCQEIREDRLCYCFDIDADRYLSALRLHKADPIKNFVIQRTKSGECACEFRNPSGQCCLAKFKHFEKEYGSTIDLLKKMV